jgi:putative transposase
MRVEQREPSRCTRELCSLLGYSRQAYYKNIKTYQQTALKSDVLLTEAIKIRKDQPRLGGRKLLYKLDGFMQAHQLRMGRDAWFDLLKVQGLLIGKRRRRKPRTTFSFHRFHKYPNRIIGFKPAGANQLWVSDITYIRLNEKFAYLSLITDAYSRKIVGYNLGKTLSADGCIAALQMAVKANPLRNEGILHHSDRGIQYCCNAYVKLLEKHHIGISMTQSGDPLENALAERVNGILKDELLLDKYDLYKQAKPMVASAISLYNNERPHSSVGMLTPVAAHLKTGELKQLWKNYYTTKREREAIMDG